MEINSLSFFSSHWAVWKILGITPKKTSRPKIYIAFSILMHLSVTVCYPLHLGLSVFQNANLTEDISNLAIFVTILACSAKFITYVYNFDKVHQIELLLQQLDSRVDGPAERVIYNQLTAQLRNVVRIFIAIYLPIGIVAEIAFFVREDRSLLYPAWFPFDWNNSTRNFYLAHFYQIFGISYLLLQNYVNDCFPAVVLFLTSAHIKMLYERFGQVGVDDASNAEKDLENCITDHKRLLELYNTIESFMSVPMLMQFTVTGLNVSISVAALMFFVHDPMTKAYFFIYGLGILTEIFPICYYGTDVEVCFGKLHYAAFRCNWLTQNKSFKKKLMLFVERSLKLNAPMAGGMLRIHVDTVFSTLKFAYSLFTFLVQMRK